MRLRDNPPAHFVQKQLELLIESRSADGFGSRAAGDRGRTASGLARRLGSGGRGISREPSAISAESAPRRRAGRAAAAFIPPPVTGASTFARFFDTAGVPRHDGVPAVGIDPRDMHDLWPRVLANSGNQTFLFGSDFPQVAERCGYAGSNKAVSIERDSVRKEQQLDPCGCSSEAWTQRV